MDSILLCAAQIMGQEATFQQSKADTLRRPETYPPAVKAWREFLALVELKHTRGARF
ncbi:MAG: hypothetical protein MK081_13440 [Flavobacteriales bacterium]|nr:hypothetical protein [Flavobacteriales bacterium]